MIEVAILKKRDCSRAYVETEDAGILLCEAPSGREAAKMAANRLRTLARRFDRLAELNEQQVHKEDVQDMVNQWLILKT